MTPTDRLRHLLNPASAEEHAHVDKISAVLGETLVLALVAMISRESSRPIEIVQVVDDDPELPDDWHEDS